MFVAVLTTALLLGATASAPGTPEAGPRSIDEATRMAVQADTPDQRLVAGEVLIPAKGFSGQVLVLVSGTGRQSRDFQGFGGRYHPHRDIAEALLAAGTGVVWFDERGTGASTGDHDEARISDMREDVRRVAHKAAEIEGVRQVFVYGHSEGSIYAMQLADDPKITAIAVSGATARPALDLLREQVRAMVPKDDVSAAEWERAVAARFAADVEMFRKKPLQADIFDLDLTTVASSVKKPILVLQGGADGQVPAPQGEELAKLIADAGNSNVTFRNLEKVNHLLANNPPGVSSYRDLPDFSVASAVTDALVQWMKVNRFDR